MPTFKRAKEKEETILLLLAIFREGLGPAAAETSVSSRRRAWGSRWSQFRFVSARRHRAKISWSCCQFEPRRKARKRRRRRKEPSFAWPVGFSPQPKNCDSKTGSSLLREFQLEIGGESLIRSYITFCESQSSLLFKFCQALDGAFSATYLE